MTSSSAVAAAVGFSQAQQVSQVQMAVAAKALKVANSQGSAALELIEAASDSLAQASAELGSAIGRMVDVHG